VTSDEATALVTGLLARHTGLEPAAISLDMHLQDELGIDSVDAAELLVSLEQQTSMAFELEALEDLATVSAVVARLVGSSAEATPRTEVVEP